MDASSDTFQGEPGTRGLPPRGRPRAVLLRGPEAALDRVSAPDWLATATGFQFLRAKAGLQPGGIQNIYTDRVGRLWLASARGGLFALTSPKRNTQCHGYTTAPGLSSNSTEPSSNTSPDISRRDGPRPDRLDPERIGVKHFSDREFWLRLKYCRLPDQQGALCRTARFDPFAPRTDAPAQLRAFLSLSP